MRELENQPETNLLPEEVEEKFSQLMVRRREGGEEGGGRGVKKEEGGGEGGGRGRHDHITSACLPTLCFSCLIHSLYSPSPISHTLSSHTHLSTPPPISHSPLHTPSNSHTPSLRTSSLILRHLNLRRQS